MVETKNDKKTSDQHDSITTLIDFIDTDTNNFYQSQKPPCPNLKNRGICEYGNKCHYSHQIQCSFFEKNFFCSRKECPFTHQIRKCPEIEKKGYCRKKLCCFYHDPQQDYFVSPLYPGLTKPERIWLY